MKKKTARRIRRIVSLCLVMAMMLTGTSVYALAANANTIISDEELESGISITYNVETGEITYGNDQNYIPEYDANDEIKGNYEGISPTGIIGPDDRVMVKDTTAYPYNAICFVESTFPDGTVRRGSGSLVHSNVMLTAGDMVYSHDYGGWATQVLVTPALNSDGNNHNRPYGTAYSTNLTSNVQWTQNKSVEWDWAIVDLDRSFNSWLRVGYNNNYTIYIGMKASTVGYPRDKGFQMWQDTNSISAASERTMKILCDIGYGDGGAPVMDLQTGQIAGIVVSEQKENGICIFNGAVRINQDLYNRIQAHINNK